VVGTDSERARLVMTELYRPLYINETPMVFTTRRTSELIKYAANAFLAMKITFINEMADLCDSVGANVQEVARGIGLDGRIGARFLRSGIGWGGSCFGKDVSALIQMTSEYGYKPELLDAARAVNARQRRLVIQKLQAALKIIKGRTVGLLGLAFKPDTDDVRSSVAIELVEKLLREGAHVTAYDPKGMEKARELKAIADAQFANSALEAVEDAEALILATEWNEFANVDLGIVKKSMRTPLVFDGRNLFDPGTMAELGFHYYSIGRAKISPR
jgi:UDPglucose 6-dehydrogenase